MSANLSKIPGLRFEAVQTLKLRESVKVAHNTYVERRNNAIALRYHLTDIVVWHASEVYFTSGGWQTATTKARLSRVLYAYGFHLHQKSFTWLISAAGLSTPIAWFDGITLSQLQNAREKRA